MHTFYSMQVNQLKTIYVNVLKYLKQEIVESLDFKWFKMMAIDFAGAANPRANLPRLVSILRK